MSVPVGIQSGMRNPSLKGCRRVSQHLVEVPEWAPGDIPLVVFAPPELLIREDTLLLSAAGGRSDPSHRIWIADVVAHREFEARRRRNKRHNGRQMGRELLGRCPLVASLVRATKHRHLSVTERLCGDPLNNVEPVLGFLDVWRKRPFRVSPTSGVDYQYRKPVTRDHARPGVEAVTR